MNTYKTQDELESHQIILKESRPPQMVQWRFFNLNNGKNMIKSKPIFIRKILGVNEYDKQLEKHQNTQEENIVEINYQSYKPKEY